MSYKNIKQEIENLSQDHLSEELYYTDKGECFQIKNEKSEKIFESINHKPCASSAIIISDKINENLAEPNLLNPEEINNGIKFSSVFSGKNIIIHGGGTIATLGNANNEDYVLIGGIVPRGILYLEFICPVSCQGLFFGMATLNEMKDLSNLKKNFRSFRTSSRRRVGLEINYEQRIVKFFLEGILKDKYFTIKEKNASFPCIILNNKNVSVILNPFARLSNVTFPLYLAPDSVYKMPNKSIFSKMLFLTNVPKVKIESKVNFLKTHFKIEALKEENIIIPVNCEGEAKGIIILKFENKNEQSNFRNNNKSVRINNNEIKILEENYLNDLSEKTIFKVMDLISMTKKDNIRLDISFKKINSLESIKNDSSEEDKLIVEYIIENFDNINFLEHTITQMLGEIERAADYLYTNRLVDNSAQKKSTEEAMLRENANLKLEYLPLSDKMFLVDKEAIKVFERNSQGFFDYEFYYKESKNYFNTDDLVGFNSKNKSLENMINILIEKNELSFFLNNIPWSNIMSEIIDYEILKCINNFVNGIKNIKFLNPEFVCFPLKKKHSRKFIEIIINYLNRIVFIMKEKNKITNTPNQQDENKSNVEMDQFLPFAPDYEEPLNEENKKQCFYDDYKNLSSETILLLYKIAIKILEQIEVNFPVALEKHSSISQCIRWGSAYSRLSTFVNFPNMTDKISVFDLANRGFYVDHSLYNELKFHGHNFFRSLNYNKIKDHESLDNLINQEYPFNLINLSSYWPNVELAYTINASPAKIHQDPLTKDSSSKIELFNKSNAAQLLITCSENGLTNIWDYTLGVNLLGSINVKKGIKEVNSFSKVSEVFWVKTDTNNSNSNALKSFNEILNEENFDIILSNGSAKSTPELGKDKEKIVVNNELVNNLYIMGFPIDACKHALKHTKNNFDKALEYLLEKTSDPEFMKQFETKPKTIDEEVKIAPWNCDLCTFLNTKGNLNCEMCSTLIPERILNEHVDVLNIRKEEEKLNLVNLVSTREEQVIQFKDCLIKNVHVVFDKSDPIAPVLVCAILFDFILNKIIVSVYKLMINPVIFRDFISHEKDFYVSTIDNRKFTKLEELLVHLIDSYSSNVLSLYPQFNKGINAVSYEGKSSNFITLIPIEHYHRELSVNSYFDSFTYENENGKSELVILSESVNSEININHFTINNNSKVNNMSSQSIILELNQFNLNDHFLNEFPTELKIVKDLKFTYIIDYTQIRKFNVEMDLVEIVKFNSIGLFKKIEPIYDSNFILKSVKIYDDVSKFTEVFLDNHSKQFKDSSVKVSLNKVSGQESLEDSLELIAPEKLEINEIEYLSDLLNFEKVDIKLNRRNRYGIVRGNNSISSKKIFVDLKLSNSNKNLTAFNNSFEIEFSNNVPLVISNINFYYSSKNKTLKSLNYCSEDLFLNNPQNILNLKEMNTELENKNDLHNLIPLTVTDFKGAQFQQFINVSSIIFGKNFTSNYFKPEFLFSHIHEKMMSITSVVLGSEMNSKTGEIPFGEGLLFLINDIDSINLAHEFTHFEFSSFSNFVKNKEQRKEDFFEWEPVAYINMGEKEFVRTKIYESRPCKYVLLLPTNARSVPKNYKKGFNTSVMSLNLFAAEGTVFSNEFERADYFNRSAKSLLKSNAITEETKTNVKITANGESASNLVLTEIENLKINSIIPNTFCSFENTDILISKNQVENLVFPDKLVSNLKLEISQLDQIESELIGFTIECLTFKKIEESSVMTLKNLKNIDVHSLRTNLIDKDKFELFNQKFCDLLITENVDFKKKHAIIRYFNCLILRIPSMVEKICLTLNLTKFIIVNILQNDEDLLINSSLSFLIAVKLSLKSENLINSVFEILDTLNNLKISYSGLNSFILLINNTFNEATVNSNDSAQMNLLYSKLLNLINNSLLNLNEKAPFSQAEIFIKNYLKTEEFPLDEKLFCVNKETIAKTNDISEYKLIQNNCFAENNHGAIRFTIDLFKIYNVKSLKLNFSVNDQSDHYFKMIVWGSNLKANNSSKEDFKILHYKNYLDDMWKQLTKYDTEIKANEKYFFTKDFRSIEIPNINHNCRYLIIEINSNQGQRTLKKLPQITIIPEVVGELLYDREPYTFKSIRELFEGFISSKVEAHDTLNRKYKVKYSVDSSKYIIYSQEDNYDASTKDKIISETNKDEATNSNIIHMKNSLKTYQNQLENSVVEFIKNIESFDLIAENKLKAYIQNIISLQKSISSSDRITNYEELRESQYTLINYFIKEINSLIDKSSTIFQEAFNNYFDTSDKKEKFVIHYIESLILNAIGEHKEDAVSFLDIYIWNTLSNENLESIFNIIFNKFIAQESSFRSSRVLLEGISKINFNISIILNKLKTSFEKKYQEAEISDGFYSISSLIFVLIMKIKNEKNKKNIKYELLIESSLKIINDLTKEIKFVKEVDDLILSHALNLLQESYSYNSFESLDDKNDSQLVDFMIETLFNLWNKDYIKNKLFFIINRMIDPLSVLESIKNKENNNFQGDVNNILKYTQNIFINVQSFTLKFLENITKENEESSNAKVAYVLDLNNKILSIHSFLYNLKQNNSAVEKNTADTFEKIKDNSFEIVGRFLKYFSILNTKKIGISVENNLWKHVFSIILCGDLKRLVGNDLLDNLIFEIFLNCNDDLKDNLYSQIIRVFATLYSNEKEISEKLNDKIILMILKLINNIEKSEKIILPFLNQLLELIACGETPFASKKNEKLIISEKIKESLFIQVSNYIIKYLNYSSYTGSTSSNKVILQHLNVGISLLHIVNEFANDYLLNVENLHSEISFSIRNYLIFITFNQYADFTNVPPTVVKISALSSLANKIIDICCKRKKLIEIILTEFMTIVRKIDDKLLTKIKNSEISIKKGIVISKKLYYSLDLILNKCLYDDEITKFFAFNLQGFKFFVERVNRHKTNYSLFNPKSSNKTASKLNYKLNKELLEYLTEESKTNINQTKADEDDLFTENLNDLNYEEFALNGKLTLLDDQVNINTTNINWSNKKKGANSYVLTRDLKDKTYYEDVFCFKLNNVIELKNIFIAFTYSTNPERVSGIVPSVFFLGGETPEKMDCCIKLEKIDDHAYIEKSIYTYGFNFFASDPKNLAMDNNYIESLFDQLINCKAKYFKFIVRRPIVTANENSFQVKTNNMVSICLNHVSIFGTKIADMGKVIEFIQEEEKNVSIKIISKIFTAEFIDTLKYFAEDSTLINNIKEIYDAYEPYIEKHADILSNILINVSKYVYELGEWLLNRLLNVDNTEIHAKLAVEITQNNPEYVNERVNKYLSFIVDELSPESPIFYSNNCEAKLKNLGKFADYLSVILNGLIVSPFFENSLNLNLDLNKFILIIKNLRKYTTIGNEINKLITILLIPNKKLVLANYLDTEEAILLLHNFYLENNYYDYALILSYLVSNNQYYEKFAVKRKIINFYFDQFLYQVNKGLRGKNMLSLMQIIRNLSFSPSVINIIQENDYDFKILEAIKNKDSRSETILINNNCTFLENVVTFLKNSMIKREECHKQLAKILIEDLEVCKKKIDKIYANNILMPLLRMENTVNLCLHPIDSFFNSILSAYCNIGHLTANIKEEILDANDWKFIVGSSLSAKAIENLHKILKAHIFSDNYKFTQKSFNLKLTSETVSSNYVKTFAENISDLNNILILFYSGKPEKDCNTVTAFFLDAKFPHVNELEGSDYPEYFIPYTDKNILIQIDGDKYNKNTFKNYHSAETIGEFVLEDGYLSFNFYSEHDNPIRIYISPEEGVKKEFTIKLSNKTADKTFDLEFKPLHDGYFEIFTCESNVKKEANKTGLGRRDSTSLSTGKISPSKFIDTNGNLDFEKIKSMKYYKKTHPLLVTRNNPVYEIPANITIKHLKNLFGSGDLSLKLLANQLILTDEKELQDIFNKSLKLMGEQNILDICYDINQLRGLATVSNDEQTSIQNYEPQLPVYKAFEKLDGIMKIISVLKSSILMWKNKEATDNWLKWIDDVEKFSVLPTFFSTLIRHQKCFNIIFDLLCGLYDQENFNKEICVETSNYIYEIINNTFIATESASLRQIAIEKGIFNNILQKLEILTREKPRRYLIEQQAEDNKADENKNKSTQANKPADDKKSKKGVGYGSDHTGDNKSWDVNMYLENKKANSEQIASIIKLLANFFNTKELKITEDLNKLILESVILPVLESAYRGGTLLELAKQDTLYYAYLDLTLKLSENKNLIPYLLDINKDYKPPQTESIYNLLGQLNEGAKIFSNCIKSGTNEEISHEEKLATAINKTHEIVSKHIKAYQVNLKTDKDYSLLLKLPLEKSYSLLMRELSFDYMNMKDSNGKMVHYYASSLTKDNNPSKLIRLAQEYADLSRALPCEYTNSIFVRVDEQNMDFIKVLIMGSAGTPYAHGAFEFDVHFDTNYPAGPPKVTLVTTGSGSVRYNPNLYSNGKVCLSLLGTWRGNSTENWDPKISTLLQVLISIQSIIMSDLVYFNEPSCEAEMGKPEGEARNEAYSNIVKYCNIKYAMIEQIKKPSKGFEELIQRHFYLKKNQIIEEVKQWIEKSKTTVAKYTSFSYDHNPSWAQKMNSQPAFTKMMEEIFVELEKELNDLPIPSELKRKQEESEKNALNKKNDEKLDFISLENVDVTYENDTSESNKEININDEAVKDRWSRYIGAMGIDAVQRQANSNIFLSGASGLGIEIAKNLVLSGCKKFVLHDTKKTSFLDLSSQFFLSEEDVNFNRAERCIKKLQQLNFYVKVVANVNQIPKTDELLDAFGLQEFNVVILTECDIETLIAVNKYCRKRNILFINADLYGVFGRVINDFGSKFTVNDIDGEELKDCMIKSITNEKEGLVTVLDNTRHNFQDGDEILISEVIGMKNLNSDKGLIFIDETEKKAQLTSINESKHVVKVKNPQSFYIGDTTGYTAYERNGMAKQIKSTKQMEFSDIEKVLFDKELSAIDQNMAISDFTKIAHTNPLHIGFQALSDFKVNFNNLPAPWNIDDFKKLLEIAEKISQDYKYELTPKDKKLIAFLSFTAQTQFNPLAAFFGGLIAQEAVKAMTGKFMPIKQIFYYDSIEVLPGFEINDDENILESIEKLAQSEKYALSNDRLDGIRTIVGKEILEKMRKMKILVVGAGAIGCELLKNFSMLEVGSFKSEQKEKEQNGIIVTDPDVIEVSNLNRQFLFREKHLRLPKSSTAAAAVIQMNKNLKNNVYAKLDKVWEETEYIFTDKLFSGLSLVANALDNIRARRYVDSRCVSNRIPLLESGTLGPKGHVQVVVPFKTESYSSQQDPEVSTDIPQCTLKMFPEEALHCIEWARDLFGKLFSQKPKNVNRILDEGIESQEYKLIKQAVNLLKHKPNNFDDCIKLAREKFEKLFRNNIKQLMYSYPLDKKNKDGSLFWSLPKRPPTEVLFNPKDPLHYSFIAAFTSLIAKQFKIKIPYENPRKEEAKIDMAEKATKVQFPEFKINALKAKEIEKQVEKEKKEVEELSDKDKIDLPEKEEDDEKNLDVLISNFKNLCEKHKLNNYNELSEKERKQMELSAEEFEKDNDSNFHIDIISAMSNLRCRNYKLEEMDWMKVKIKAGKIIPALATTTASIAGLQALELVKLAKNMEIEHIRNSFLNLAIPYLQASEPGPVSKNKIAEGLEVTLWDRWEFKPENNNMHSIYEFLKNKYKVFPRDCFLGKKAVFPYNAYVGEDKKVIRDEIMNKDLFKLLGLNSDEEYVDLMITFTADEQSEEYIKNTPSVRILLK